MCKDEHAVFMWDILFRILLTILIRTVKINMLMRDDLWLELMH